MRNFNHLYRMNLSHREVPVYIYLTDRANKENVCWPAIPTISRNLKLSESTTRRALKDLRNAGLIQTEQRHRENGGNSSLLFTLSVLFPKGNLNHMRSINVADAMTIQTDLFPEYLPRFS